MEGRHHEAVDGAARSPDSLFLLGLLFGCRQERLTETNSLGTNVGPSVGRIVAVDPHDLPALDIDLPEQPKLWAMDDAALVAEIRKSNGLAFVAFKNPVSTRTEATRRVELAEAPRMRGRSPLPARQVPRGTRQQVSAESIRQGLAVLVRRGAHIRQYYENLGFAWVDLSADSAPAIRRDSLIDWVEPDGDRGRTQVAGRVFTRRASFASATDLYLLHWGEWMIGAPGTWGITTGLGARLLIIDTGLDTSHVDMPRGIPSVNCIGYFTGCTDEILGVHGTPVGSVILAQTNSYDVLGIAYGIAPSDIFTWGACYYSTDPRGDDGHLTSPVNVSCPHGETNSALNWAAGHLGPRGVINMSIGWRTPYTDLATGIAAVLAADIVVVSSAGNVAQSDLQQSQMLYPAAFSGVIAVSGVNQDSSFAAAAYPTPCTDQGQVIGSNQGSFVSIAAPYFARTLVPSNQPPDNNEVIECGTSFSAPYVAGTAALIRAAHPTYTRQEVSAQLVSTALPRVPASQFGAGIVQAELAVGFTPPTTTGSISAGKVFLSWSSVSEAARYHVYRSVTPQSPSWTLWADVPATTTSFLDSATRVTSFLGYDVTPNINPYVNYTVVSVYSSGQESRIGHTLVYAPSGNPVY